ncbi:MAG: two-component regulator propeller domain-containing protein [Chitinophagaceae bacterium]
MTRSFYKLPVTAFVFSLFTFLKAEAQSLSFFHLNTAEGLSDNTIRSLAVDKKGFLWIGTGEGLNVFDGYEVTSYLKEQHPQMASNNVIHLTCDRNNRIWMGTSEGISWVDAKREFHRVTLMDSISRFASRTILDTKKYGPVLYTNHGQFFFDSTAKNWKKLTWIPELLKYNRFSDAESFHDDKVIYATDSLVLLLDYATGTVMYQQPFSKVVSVCRYSDQELAIAFQHGLVQIVNIQTKEITRQYQLTGEFNKKQLNAQLNEIRPAANGDMLVSTEHDGLVVISKTGTIARYTHDPIYTNSIASDLTRRVISSPEGEVIVGSSAAGISSFNIYNKTAGYTGIFSDRQGNFYDSYMAKIGEDPNGILWIGAAERVIKWDKKKNLVKFYYYYSEKTGQSHEVRSLCIDRSGRVWAGTLGNGVSVLSESNGQFKPVVVDTTLGPAFKSNVILDLFTASDGMIWVATIAGVYTIDPATLTANTYKKYPALQQLTGKRINAFLEDRKGRMWMASSLHGVYCYDKSTDQLLQFTKEMGMASGQCFALCEDRLQNIYAGGTQGFSIISPEGKITSYNRNNGLLYDRCDGILEDNNGKIWISNIKCLVLFDPVKKSLKIFGQHSGLSVEGFRSGSNVKASTGELFWGSRKGINYFFPEQLVDHSTALKINIVRADLPDTSVYITDNDRIRLRYEKNNVIFRFTAISLQGSKDIHYRFMLEGYDKTWQEGTDIREARYSLVPAGSYTFKVMASPDGINWTVAKNTVLVTVIPPLWQRWWFITAGILLFAGGALGFIRNRAQKLKKQREQLETEQAIHYFTSSMSEQQTEENILWDVAKNCVGRLHFENCSIYTVDEENNRLINKAAHGPVSPRLSDINRSFEITPGNGLAGRVAFSGKAEIANSSKMAGLTVNGGTKKQSAISVPILYNDKVLGVLECNHSKKMFFTQKHLSILTTIASLCANKIVRARAEKEKKEEETILMTTQRKMTEVEMQALRAQMNPHFIFNCLNSINRYIVKSDQTTASLYLTKFAKLIRLILDNSNSKNVILTNELEALKLYIEMEALRFDKKFTYEIKVEGDLSTDTVEVPPLIIQPYVENAIWHGLLHKESDGHLSVRLSMTNEFILQCVIEDNGIGREKAKELKSKTATSRKSLGMQLTENRLSLLNKHAELHASIEIIDMEKGNGEGAGTKVILKIPV